MFKNKPSIIQRFNLWEKRGFTLIELLVVIAIISLLSSVVLASLNSARIKARHARRASDLKQLQLALNLYYDSQTPNAYPVSTGWMGVHSCWGSATADWVPGLVTGRYIPKLPRDPSDSGSAVDGQCAQGQYIYNSNGTDYKLLNHALEDCEGAAKDSNMKDPTRDGGTNPAIVDGNACWAIGIWTPGAVTW